MVPRLPYFFTKCDKKRLVDRRNGGVVVGLDVEVDASMDAGDAAAAAVVGSARTFSNDIKCTVNVTVKINLNNFDVILCLRCYVEFILFLMMIINDSAYWVADK